jgi:phosphoribosylglycinamide formyltransferase 1
MDHGPIILQQAIPIRETDTAETLEKRIHAAEHRLYPKAVKLFVEGKLKVSGRKVLILR